MQLAEFKFLIIHGNSKKILSQAHTLFLITPTHKPFKLTFLRFHCI